MFKDLILIKNSDYKGIILDGLTTVGSFKTYTAEDCYGKRNIIGMKLNSNYYNESLSSTGENNLKFLYVKIVSDFNYTVIDDIGCGTVFGRGFHDGQSINIDEAQFVKVNLKLKNSNAN